MREVYTRYTATTRINIDQNRPPIRYITRYTPATNPHPPATAFPFRPLFCVIPRDLRASSIPV
jgi:hypothetical protein